MDGGKAENGRNFRNGILAFLNEYLAFLQLEVTDVFLWRCIYIVTEQ